MGEGFALGLVSSGTVMTDSWEMDTSHCQYRDPVGPEWAELCDPKRVSFTHSVPAHLLWPIAQSCPWADKAVWEINVPRAHLGTVPLTLAELAPSRGRLWLKLWGKVQWLTSQGWHTNVLLQVIAQTTTAGWAHAESHVTKVAEWQPRNQGNRTLMFLRLCPCSESWDAAPERLALPFLITECKSKIVFSAPEVILLASPTVW